VSPASYFSKTFCCKHHKGEVYIMLQNVTSMSSEIKQKIQLYLSRIEPELTMPELLVLEDCALYDCAIEGPLT